MLIRGLLLAILSTANGTAWASVDSHVASIERDVAQIEQDTAGYAQKRDEHCDGEDCTGSISFFDAEGRLRKVVEQFHPADGPGKLTARYYNLGCRLLLVRAAPTDPAKVRDPRSVEKYYFHHGHLIRADFGGEPQTFTKDQLAYYERTLRIEPPTCR